MISDSFPYIRPYIACLLISSLFISGCLSPPPYSFDNGTPQYEVLLSPINYQTIIVDVDYASSYIPSELALNALKQTLENITKKTVIIGAPTQFDTDVDTWNSNQLALLNAQHFDYKSTTPYLYGDNATLHVVYLPGNIENENALGFYLDDFGSIYVLADVMSDLRPIAYTTSNQIPDITEYTPKLERHILIHELGHALGLVGCGVPMIIDHDDMKSSCHSNNPDSPMYTERGNPEQGMDPSSIDLTFTPPWIFDQNERNDLSSFRQHLSYRNNI